jgi:hypothetical protein
MTRSGAGDLRVWGVGTCTVITNNKNDIIVTSNNNDIIVMLSAQVMCASVRVRWLCYHVFKCLYGRVTACAHAYWDDDTMYPRVCVVLRVGLLCACCACVCR